MNFEAFAAQHLAHGWPWGEVDCGLVLADWVIWNGLPDVAGHLRGTYCDEAGCRAAATAGGGLLTIVGDLAFRAGLMPLRAPENGAIAVVGSRAVATRQWGAIHDGRYWRVRMQNAFAPVRAQPLAIWGIPCRKP